MTRKLPHPAWVDPIVRKLAEYETPCFFSSGSPEGEYIVDGVTGGFWDFVPLPALHTYFDEVWELRIGLKLTNKGRAAFRNLSITLVAA